MASINSKIKPDGWTASLEIIFHESATFMDYLHGAVEDEETESAGYYEYARESWQMWRAAKVREDASSNEKPNYENDYSQNVHYELEIEEWIRTAPWATELLICKSFPAKDWNELSEPEREKIMLAISARRKVEPLPLQILRYSHYPKEEFPEFNELAAQAKPVMKNVLPGEPHDRAKITRARVKKSGAVYYCLFNVDFSESKNLLHDRFVECLKQDEIERDWNAHKKQRTGKNPNALRSTKIVPPKGEWRASTYWCLFEVDLSARKGDLTKQFEKWLALPKIKKLLNQYKIEKRGSSDKWKDRLKDLAAWRLYRENENSCDKANNFANANRKKFETWPEIYETCKKVNGKWPYKPNDPRPFRDAKRVGDDALNSAPLFSCADDYRHAKGEVIRVLSDWIPDEFKQPSSENHSDVRL